MMKSTRSLGIAIVIASSCVAAFSPATNTAIRSRKTALCMVNSDPKGCAAKPFDKKKVRFCVSCEHIIIFILIYYSYLPLLCRISRSPYLVQVVISGQLSLGFCNEHHHCKSWANHFIICHVSFSCTDYNQSYEPMSFTPHDNIKGMAPE